MQFTADYCGLLRTGQAIRRHHMSGPTLMESMIIVYMKTGDEKLYNWCLDYIKWLDTHDNYHHGMASFQRDSLEYNEDHVVAFGENVKHPALIYLAGGEPGVP